MNILLIDDHWLFLEGMKALFEKVDGVKKVLITDEPKIALSWLNVLDFELIVTDLNMPDMRGEDLIKLIKQKKMDQKVIALSMHSGINVSQKVKLSGANGILSKSANFETIENLVKKVLLNPTNFIEQREETNGELNIQVVQKHMLTPKEKIILEQLLTNKTNNELAECNNVSIETIKSHRKNLYRKLGVNNILDLYKLLQ